VATPPSLVVDDKNLSCKWTAKKDWPVPLVGR
jgi:hypothetical protein